MKIVFEENWIVDQAKKLKDAVDPEIMKFMQGIVNHYESSINILTKKSNMLPLTAVKLLAVNIDDMEKDGKNKLASFISRNCLIIAASGQFSKSEREVK